MGFSFLVLREFRDAYPSKWALFGELMGLVVSLAVYWYTAKAFGKVYGMDYFSFIIIGEVALFMPLALFEGIARSIRRAIAEGTMDALLLVPARPQLHVISLGTALLPKEMVRVVLTLCGALLLVVWAGPRAGDTAPSIASIAGAMNLANSIACAMLLQLAAVPIFLGLGLIVASLVVRFGRGDSVISYVGMVAAVAAGAYFPVSVFPEQIRELFSVLSPFNMLLEATRLSLSEGLRNPMVSRNALTLAAMGVCLFPTGFVALGLSFERARKKGDPWCFTA